VLELKDVDFVRDGKLLLAGVSLTVGEGERWALLGPNGAGKSTLLGLCGAVTHPTRGTVEILGRRLGTVDIRELLGAPPDDSPAPDWSQLAFRGRSDDKETVEGPEPAQPEARRVRRCARRHPEDRGAGGYQATARRPDPRLEASMGGGAGFGELAGRRTCRLFPPRPPATRQITDTTGLVSETFNHPIQIEGTNRLWTARTPSVGAATNRL
jgi:energy-coupling factor transporter ATP-binding protein EcfA2